MNTLFKVTGILLLFGGLAFGQNPETAVFPDDLAADDDLLVAQNAVQTTLAAAVTTTTETEFTVADASGITAFPTGCWVDSEIVKVMSKVGSVLTVVRQYDSTFPATHLFAATFTCGPIARFNNQQNAELKAMQLHIIRCSSPVELTLVGGAITIPSSACYTVDTQDDDATDDLTVINCAKGIRFRLTPASTLRTVRLIDDGVNIDIQANFSLNHLHDELGGRCFDTNVVIEEDRSNAGT